MLGGLRARPNEIKARSSRPTWKNCSLWLCNVHCWNATQYYSTETVLLIFPFFQTNITVQMRSSRGQGGAKVKEKAYDRETWRRCGRTCPQAKQTMKMSHKQEKVIHRASWSLVSDVICLVTEQHSAQFDVSEPQLCSGTKYENVQKSSYTSKQHKKAWDTEYVKKFCLTDSNDLPPVFLNTST